MRHKLSWLDTTQQCFTLQTWFSITNCSVWSVKFKMGSWSQMQFWMERESGACDISRTMHYLFNAHLLKGVSIEENVVFSIAFSTIDWASFQWGEMSAAAHAGRQHLATAQCAARTSPINLHLHEKGPSICSFHSEASQHWGQFL